MLPVPTHEFFKVREGEVHMQILTGRPPAAIALRETVWQGFVEYGFLPVFLFAVCATRLLPHTGAVPTNLVTGTAMVLVLVTLVSAKHISDHVAALAFFAVAVGIFGLPPNVAFAGFFSGASWLILSGIILGAAMNDTGLSLRVANGVLGRIGNSYRSVIFAITALSLILVFLIPSTAARVLLLVPIITALADRLGYRRDGKGFAGMVIAVAVMCYLPCTGVMTSNVRNLGVLGATKSLHGASFGYTDFLLWNFPILSLMLTGIFALLLIRRYGEPPQLQAQTVQHTAVEPREKGVLAIVLCTLALWMTDFAHGVSPAWIGLGAAVLCLYGPCRDMAFAEKVKLGNWLIFVAFIGLAAILGHTGLGNWLGTFLVESAALVPGKMVWNLGAVTVIGIVVGLVTTNLAGPVVLVSLAQPIADATGWSLQGTIVAMMPSWSIFPFAYQAPVILLAMRMTNVPVRELNICLLLITAIALLVIIPLQFVWLWALGVIG